MSNLKSVTEVSKAFEWEEVYKLPHYYLVSNPYKFLLVAVWAEQHPIGTLREEHGRGWYVLFKYSSEIKFVNKYPEESNFDENEWKELRESMNSEQAIYYDLLTEAERIKEMDEYEDQ